VKKLLFIVFALIIISGMLIVGCGKTTTTTPASQTATTTVAAKQPVSGGILRIIQSSGPQVLSYKPIMGPGDYVATYPGAEALVSTTSERGEMSAGCEPVLCDSVDVDQQSLTITFNIKHGVYFSDGSELTAEVAAWNLQLCIDAKSLPYLDFYKDMRVTEKYTLVIDMTQWNNQMMPTWGWWTPMFSKKAWDDASGGDLNKGIEWARSHLVGTGPFILKEFIPDVSMTWVKNPNYWRKDRPYLDEIDIKFVPDSVTARAAFEAGEADVWGAPAKDAQELIAKGYFEQVSWALLPWGIWPNTANPDCKMNKKNLREAVEYAIDKNAIAQAIGHGLFKPLKSVPWEGEWGYDPTMGRSYDPQKAKDLLALEGYSATNPCKVNLLLTNAFGPDMVDACTMSKQMLDAVGFEVTLDIADAGRFFGVELGRDNVPRADQDLCWYFAGGCDTNYLQTYVRWFSTQPFNWVCYMGRTAEQAAMDNQAMGVTTIAEQITWTGTCMHYIIDNCLDIPVYGSPAYVIQQTYVHSTIYTQGLTRWQTEEVWMEKH
jgi:ABC-type transport system substrate-binding protein